MIRVITKRRLDWLEQDRDAWYGIACELEDARATLECEINWLKSQCAELRDQLDVSNAALNMIQPPPGDPSIEFTVLPYGRKIHAFPAGDRRALCGSSTRPWLASVDDVGPFRDVPRPLRCRNCDRIFERDHV